MTDLPSGPDSIPVAGLALVILDGWGLAEPGPGNAVSQSGRRPSTRSGATYPHTQLSASGHDVGLPDGQMGNSEVGHLNLGAGSVVKQDLARIDDAVADGSFFENEVLVGACERARNSPRGRLHLIGLVSDGGVHSGWEHIEACIELAAREGVPDLVLHALHRRPRHESRRRRRATSRRSSGGCAAPGGSARSAAATTAMDRDHRWERTKLAYDAMVHGAGPRADSAGEAIADAYAAGDTDEFIKPTVIGDYDGMQPGDVVITFNFRPDRMRQIVEALGDPAFEGFERGGDPGLDIATMASYRARLAVPGRLPAHALRRRRWPRSISEAGGTQIHVAETEKYAHVTYFFNGGREAEWNGEERRMADSPRDVPTYDHKPEMSAAKAADAFCSAWEEGGYRFGIINFANPDMVGHTGVDPGRDQRDRGRRRLPRAGRRDRPRGRRRLHHHRRPRQRRAHARARRLAEHRPHDEPGAADHDRRTGSSCTRGSSPTSRRRRSTCSGSRSRQV